MADGPVPLAPLLKVTLYALQVSLWIPACFPVLPLGDANGGRQAGADSHPIHLQESQSVSHQGDFVHDRRHDPF